MKHLTPHISHSRARQHSVASLVVFSLAFSGCASIVDHHPLHDIYMTSAPDKAFVTVFDQKTGHKVFQGETPVTVPLESSRGYFKGKEYRVVLVKEGHPTHIFQLRPTVSGWYIGGNLLLGGLLGWLLVDPLTGDMWKLSPTTINADLDEQDASGSDSRAP